jgi:L,D-transpeptidase YnhG
MTRSFLAAGLVCTVLLVQAGWAVAADEKKQRKKKPQQTSLQAAKADRQRSKAATTAATAAVAAAVVAPRAVARPAPAVRDGETEARLIEVYRLIGQARGRDALARAEALVRDHPNFQLAQLVYGDLLASQTRPVRTIRRRARHHRQGGRCAAGRAARRIPGAYARAARAPARRHRAVAVPDAFIPREARDCGRRVALAPVPVENTATGLKLMGDYYISVGKLGIEKVVEGDQRTPLGVYFITSNLDPKSLKDFYGSGALPINYPNAYDARRGKTGSGIWLHGTPPNQFSRAPKATDGCVVLANPDLERIISTVEVRTTPVVIAPPAMGGTANHACRRAAL